MKTQAQTQRGSFRTPGRLGWVFLLPALALSLPAQPVGPEMDIERAAAVISWPVSTTNYIVLSSATPTNGPWYPCLDPIARGPGRCQVAVRTTDHSQYFRLAQGEWFMDDFEDGDLEGWTVAYADPQATNYLMLEPTNGQFRIHGSCPSCTDGHVAFGRTNLMMGDFALSIDILGWDESVVGDRPTIVLAGRVGPSFPDLATLDLYEGGVGMRYTGDPYQSALFLGETLNGSFAYIGAPQPFSKTNPAKDYRLVFYCVGGQLTVQLFDLTDGGPPVEYTAPDTSLTAGLVGFYVVGGHATRTVDITLDNFVAVGTTP